MSNNDMLSDLQRDVANDLIEWKDSGAPVEAIVLSIQRMILADMRHVFANFNGEPK